MKNAINHALVLALSPNARGYGFVLFESALAPYDWGVKELRKDVKHRRIVRFVKQMIDRYRDGHDHQPLVLVLEDWSDRAFRRSDRTLKLYLALTDLCRKHSVQFMRIGKTELHQYFGSVLPTTKYEIALAIAKHIPALSFQVPPVRRIWMSEDPRQGLYDAAALGLAYYGRFDAASGALPAIIWA